MWTLDRPATRLPPASAPLLAVLTLAAGVGGCGAAAAAGEDGGTVEERSGQAAAGAADEDRSELDDLRPGEIRIERSPPSPQEIAHRQRLARWKPLYERHLAPLRAAHAELAAALESSSLAASRDHCRSLLERSAAVDREAILPSPAAALDRALLGLLSRYRAGGRLCLGGRHLRAHRLFEEARTGLLRIDRYLDRQLREPVRLEGLD